MNNYEKIKNMNVKQLATFINQCESNPCVTHCIYANNFCDGECIKNLNLWLQQEAE